MQLADLPSRRTEAWKWSDLRVAMAGQEEVLAPIQSRESPIAALAFGLSKEDSETLTISGTPDGVHARTQTNWDDRGSTRTVTVQAGAHGVLFEKISNHSLGDQPSVLSAQHTFIDVEEGATLHRVVLQGGSPLEAFASSAVVLNEVSIRLAAGATYRQFVLGDGGRLVRLETTVSADGDGAEVELNAVYLAAGKRHIDLTSRVAHCAPGVKTQQLVRGVARKGGRGVFQGKFLVERAGQKTDASMQHNALLLEEGAEIFAKPELEIYADDVACAHGNTSGQLDEDAIFYLRQRGIPHAEAQAMITRAFLIEAVPGWMNDELRAEVEGRIDRWLGTPA